MLGLCTAGSGIADADDWANWRGPHQDGTVEAAGQFTAGPFALEVLWKQSVGSGYSGISVAGGKVLTLFTDGGDDLLAAFDARSGSELWRFRLGEMYKAHDGAHDGPLSTPVTDGDAVYALGADGRLVAVGLTDGEERWSVSLVEKLQARIPFWGFTTTPVVVDDVVVVQAGGPNGRALAAFDKRNGAVRWTRGSRSVDYRSPVLASFHGRHQLLVSTHGETSGVDPANGKTLWTLPLGSNNSATPVAVGRDRILLGSQSGTVLFRVPPHDGQPTKVWRSLELSGNFAAPAPYQGFLYGFSGRYLVCVDATTGKRRWRSRPPGGKGVIIVDGHLVVFGDKGDVVVVEASPNEYREKARLKVSDSDGYAWPAFADGVIYVRNFRHLVAVRTTAAASVAAAALPPSNRFETFIRRLAASGDKDALLDDFMKRQSSFPIVEDGRLVHFVYRGDAEDVAVRGAMLASGTEDALHRVPGAAFFHRTYAIEPGARWEYQFVVDFDNVVPDPLNPRRAAASGDAKSEVWTPGFTQPAFVERYQGDAPGRLESFHLASAVMRGTRRIQVYLPHGYERGTERHPVVIVTAGREWVESGDLPNTLNHLVGESIEPPIVAFVYAAGGGSYRELGGAGTRDYGRMLARELVPELDRRYRTRAAPADRIILGKRQAAVAAAFTALQYPEVFGGCALISYGRADTVRKELIDERLRRVSGRKPRFFVTWNRYEIWRPQSWSAREQSSALAAELKQHGFEVLGGERLDGAGWGSWRIQVGDALKALAPSNASESRSR